MLSSCADSGGAKGAKCPAERIIGLVGGKRERDAHSPVSGELLAYWTLAKR